MWHPFRKILSAFSFPKKVSKGVPAPEISSHELRGLVAETNLMALSHNELVKRFQASVPTNTFFESRGIIEMLQSFDSKHSSHSKALEDLKANPNANKKQIKNLEEKQRRLDQEIKYLRERMIKMILDSQK